MPPRHARYDPQDDHPTGPVPLQRSSRWSRDRVIDTLLVLAMIALGAGGLLAVLIGALMALAQYLLHR